MSMIDEWVDAFVTDGVSHDCFFSRQHPGGFGNLMPNTAAEACRDIVNDEEFREGIFQRKAPAPASQHALRF